MKHWKKLLKNPPKQYRSLPFWSWNEQLNIPETARQIAWMDEAGLGGYFMHARGGLQTPYMSDEWMDNIRCGIDEARSRGMEAWGYDENGWPSGFGSGAVNGLGEAYQQKYLRMEVTDAPCQTAHTIVNLPWNSQNRHFYYEVNPYYVDTLDKRVIARFIETIHIRYRETLGVSEFSGLTGFFTDEPQISRAGIPWSAVLPDAYRERYGEELLPLLPGLFTEMTDCRRVRFQFWQLVRDLFCEAYMHQIYTWCHENGTHLTGHLVLEESMEAQLTTNAACMPSYEFMDMPGMDWLGRTVGTSVTPAQVASVAAQTGKKAVLSETFALCGWNVSFEELKWIAEWQLVRGITRLCPHLEGYSLRGIRKRDYPATLFFQQPWWGEYRQINDYFARVGMLLTEGEAPVDTLVLHPMASGWLCFDNEENGQLRELDARFDRLLTVLDEGQVPYHLGDDRILERHAAVEEAVLRVGQRRYRVVVVPDCLTLTAATAALLETFKAHGGLLLFSAVRPTAIDGQEDVRATQLAQGCRSYASPEALAADIPDSARPLQLTGMVQRVASAVRQLPEGTLHYIVNSSQEPRCITAQFAGVSAGLLNGCTGEIMPLPYTAAQGRISVPLTLPPMGSVLLMAYATECMAPCRVPEKRLPLDKELSPVWQRSESDFNALTLDYCDYYFDGELQGVHRHISNIQEEACRLERLVEVALEFTFYVQVLPVDPVWLVLETPEKFRITLNGQEISNQDDGYYRDPAFRRIPLSGHLCVGENRLRLTIPFVQRDSVYRDLRRALAFESEKNKLTYDTELEAVYLLGNFGVSVAGEGEVLDNRGVRYTEGFSIVPLPDTVVEGDLTGQGFPFFAGRIVLRQTVELTAAECVGRCLRFAERCDTVTQVYVNGQEAGTILWHPYEVSLEGLLHPGTNEIEVELIGSLRNLLGPHHLTLGEVHFVSPGLFFENSPLWCGGHNDLWDDRYCFVRHGLMRAHPE